MTILPHIKAHYLVLRLPTKLFDLYIAKRHHIYFKDQRKAGAARQLLLGNQLRFHVKISCCFTLFCWAICSLLWLSCFLSRVVLDRKNFTLVLLKTTLSECLRLFRLYLICNFSFNTAYLRAQGSYYIERTGAVMSGNSHVASGPSLNTGDWYLLAFLPLPFKPKKPKKTLITPFIDQPRISFEFEWWDLWDTK